MQYKHCTGFECRLSIGSREGYHGPAFGRDDLIGAIQQFQATYKEAIPVAVTATCSYVHKEYREDGWEVSALRYPNHLRDEGFLYEYLTNMATYLMKCFKQNRITVRTFNSPIPTVMIEQDNPEPWEEK